MAGTGLPIPKTGRDRSQPAKLTPMIDADKYSTASNWSQIASASAGLAGAGFGLAAQGRAEREQEERAAEAAYLAGQENEIARKRIELHDQFAKDPEGFDAAWRGYAEGKIGSADSRSIPHLTKALGGAGNAAYSSILAAKRAEDHRLDSERMGILVKRSADDVVGAAMANTLDTEDGQAKIAKLQATTASAVNLKLMSQEKADEIMDDAISRAHGEAAALSGLKVYQEKGFEAATAHLRASILESQSSLSPAQKQAAYAKGLQSIRLQKQIDAQDRTEFVTEANDMVNGLSAGQSIDPGRYNDVVAGLKRSGAFGTLSKLQGQVAIKNATAPYASMPPSQALAYTKSLLEGTPAATQLAQAESGGRPEVVNQFGYAGRYQFGAPRLADLGLYKPGAGEDLSTWSKTPYKATKVANADGSVSTERTITVSFDDGVFNIPTIVGGKQLSEEDAISAFKSGKSQATGKFATVDEAVAAAKARTDQIGQGLGKWTGEFNIPGFPQVKTLQDFLANPQAQDAAMQVQQQRANQEIAVRGLDRFLGQTVNGTVVTRPGIVAMIHLGGPGSAQAYLESGGQTNPADANGKTVGDYLKLGETPTDRTYPPAGVVAKAVQSEYVTLIRKDWPELKAVIESGKVTNPQDFEAVRYAAELSGDAAWRREVESMAVVQRGNQAINQGTVSQGQAMIDQIGREFDADGVRTVDEDRVLKAMEENFQRKVKQVTESPVDYALSMGANVPGPLNFADPALARAAVAERVNLARGVAQDQGVVPGSPFRAADRQAIAGAIASGDAKQAAVAMDSVFAVPDQMLVPALSPEIRSAVQGATRSTDVGKYNAAMGFLDKMWARAPETAQKLFGDDAITAMQVWQEKIRYQTSEQIAEDRAKALDPQVRERRKMAVNDGLEIARKVKPGDIAAAFDDSWLPFNTPEMPVHPDTRDALMGDFDNLFSQFYAEVPDKDVAMQKTVERLKTKWGTSQVNGGRLMLNAPERFYPAVDGNHGWMKAELEAGLARQIGKPMTTTEPEVGGFTQNWTYELVADRQTSTEAQSGQMPSYQVVVTQDGRANVLPQRVRWNTQAVEQARDRFKSERDRQAEVMRMFDRNDELAKARQAQTMSYIQSRR